jgi:23S rRNA G2445 N2-methylase RlmL
VTTHGLEMVSAREIAALPGAAVTQTAYRRIAAVCRAPLGTLLGLRTVDDVFLEVATWPGIGHTRDALGRLRVRGARLDLHGTRAHCADVRPLATPPTFAVTASFVGRRNYSAPEIKAAIAESIARTHGWSYRDDDRYADLNIRIFIEHEIAYVGVRLAASPLHERPWMRDHRPGALKPSVAAALVVLAGVDRGMWLLDPCCGGGTIAIEAALCGALARGGDSDPRAIEAARTNAACAGVAARFRVLDARRLPFADGSFDRIVSNLPWDRQVSAGHDPEAFYRRSLAEMARVLAPGGRLALLIAAPRLVQHPELRRLRQIEISLHGQRPTILVCAP